MTAAVAQTRQAGRRPAPLHYLIHSVRLTARNTGFTVFSVITPLVLYVVFSQIFGKQSNDTGGIDWAALYMVSMAAYGSLGAAMGGGAQLAVERRSGWFRQLTITTLRPREFLLAKAAVIMIMVLPALILVFVAGYVVGGVRAPFGSWLAALLLMWASLIPMTIMGLVIGLWVKAETVQPLNVLVMLVMALLGGLWFPAQLMPDAMQTIAKLMPSYWLASLGRYPIIGGSFPWQGVLVLLGWTIALTILGALGYRRAAANSKR
ncbi:ABC transporter permease [Microlunatus elymi]|uniref:Transport permease protein n=1 Tax=Microlunatus elymi TaxID=2596828 RepID=A0A516PWF5_9ACTN|nr:ABC transporter permease [Microlunatus elymi]QDP95514.1 ABC transporter permease [Microlunatus elymi]